MERVAVIIPIYKEVLTEYENISLKQCNKILNNYPIEFIGPESLDYSKYQEIIPHANINTFPPQNFESVKSYNKLMLNKIFYERFIGFEFILIYQTDSFVFSDELEYWSNMGYDYIGAPWFHNFRKYGKLTPEPWGVGNGGFSLRKVQPFLKILSSNEFVRDQHIVIGEYMNYGIRDKGRYLVGTIKKLAGINNRAKKFIETFQVNEDYFWGEYANLINKNFKVAPIKDAMKFSFECLPSKLYEMNNKNLPFGCHAWWKHDLKFWKNFIPAE